VSAAVFQRDVIFLVADRHMEAVLEGLLGRPQSLSIRAITYVIRTHPEKDPGCYLTAHDFLRPFSRRYRHSLVMFDREGCGSDAGSRETLEKELEGRLARNGWPERARAIVIDPELEAWVWSDSPQVDRMLGWADVAPDLRQWLTQQGLLQETHIKPVRPKEAMQAALRNVRKPHSSAIFRQLAENVSLRRCSDPAFQKLKTTLQSWFPPETELENAEEKNP